MEIHRLHLASLYVTAEPWPVHGFVLLHPQLGVVLIDTGCGGPAENLREFRVVNRAVADALAELDLSPADVSTVVNTHLHFDHCGQNPVFEHARLYVQRGELDRVHAEDGLMSEWLHSTGMRFELLDGDVSLAEDLRVVATPGHTLGHQSVLASGDRGVDLFVGDAAFRRSIWDAPGVATLPPGQAEDVEAWRHSLEVLHDARPARVHFCHDTA